MSVQRPGDIPRQRRKLGCPYGCPLDHHVAPCPFAAAEAEREPLHCDVCLALDVEQREHFTTCREFERCPLAGVLVGGGRDE